ncbi:unnamed protein product [Rodentolepis nana]|uniref:ETS domain-containing protein n=1 Tax=Rodentolepis nana TaxID=102285 RepID=A0A0R3TWE2_RODNA|nr:unnamed protein product [Rodentolepis nana]
MYIVNKPDTEFTGQETYVWELYQKRYLGFSPIGNCFRKQYKEELQAKYSWNNREITFFHFRLSKKSHFRTLSPPLPSPSLPLSPPHFNV